MLAIVLIADIMDLLDSTITTIAAPVISARLHGGPELIKWLGASYALSLGVLLVTGGRLGDRYGRRRIFLIGIAGFTAASLAAGCAWDPASIIVARLVQGAFGALLIPQGFGILGAVFPREQIGKAFSAFGPILGLSAVGGPLLAGVLIDANLFGLGWRPMFLINIVLGVAGLGFGVAATAPRPRGRLGADRCRGLGAAGRDHAGPAVRVHPGLSRRLDRCADRRSGFGSGLFCGVLLAPADRRGAADQAVAAAATAASPPG